MKKNKHNNLLRTASLCFLSLFVTVAAMAGNRVYVEELSVVPGKVATVNVMMENEDNISSLQLDLCLPVGLTYVDASEERNAARITRTSHSLNVSDRGDLGDVAKRFTILSKGVKPEKTAIAGHSGMIFSFNVEVSELFNGGNIILTGVIGSDATVVPAAEIEMYDAATTVRANAGTYVLSPEAVSLTLAKKDTIGFYLDETITIVGLEAKVNLPEGVEIDEMLYGDRLSDNSTLTYENGKILIESLNNEPFESIEAPVFSIVLKGTTPTLGTMTLSDVLVSNGSTAFAVDGTGAVSVEVVDLNSILYEDLKDSLDNVMQAYNDSIEVINSYTTDAGKAWADSEDAQAIEIFLTEAGLQLDADKATGIIDEAYASDFLAALDEAKTLISALAQNAADAEKQALIVVGDVNGDGEVSIADANMIVNRYLGNDEPGFIEEAADVNGDGEITIADANEIANVYLNNQ